MTYPNSCVTVGDDSYIGVLEETVRATQGASEYTPIDRPSTNANTHPATQKEHYMLDKIAPLFAIKSRQIGTALISIYISCEYLALLRIGSGGISNLSSAFTFIKLNNVSNWITTFRTDLINSHIAQWANYTLIIWLIIACIYLVKQYTSQDPSDLLPQSSLTTSFFWALGTDFFGQQHINTIYTLCIIIALFLILIINIIRREAPISRTAFAVIACTIGPPLFLTIAPVAILARDSNGNN